MDNISFKPMLVDDVALWKHWATLPHVKNVWFIDGYETVDYIYQKIKGNGYDHPFIILLNEKPIGYIVCCDLYAYRILCKTKKGLFTEEEPGTFCMDLFIGEPNCLYKGYGTKIVSLFVQKIFAELHAKVVYIDPGSNNKIAIRCYEKAGFRFFKTAHDGICETYVMICESGTECLSGIDETTP